MSVGPESWSEPRFQRALELVEQACFLSRGLQDGLQGEFFQKSDASPVTVADLAVQLLVVAGLRRSFQDDSFQAEESTEQVSAEAGLQETLLSLVEPRLGPMSEEEVSLAFQERGARDEWDWILDPIDGTKGFLRGDQFAIALACRNRAGLQFALLGCPRLRKEGPGRGSGVVTVAYRDRGAWQSSIGEGSWSSIRVSARSDVKSARLLGSYEASHTNQGEIQRMVEDLGVTAQPVCLDSQAKYALLARGDAEVLLRCLSPSRPNYKEKIWDQAPGSLILEEAGGRVTDLSGEILNFELGETLAANTGVLASNGALHDFFLEAL